MNSAAEAQVLKIREFEKSFGPERHCEPNWIKDDLKPLLTPSERAILDVIIRQTYGFGKDRDRISLEQFSFGIKREDGTYRSGANIGLNAARRCLKSLIEMKAIIRTGDCSYADGKGEAYEYMIQPLESRVDFEWLDNRLEEKRAKEKRKGDALTERRNLKKAQEDTQESHEIDANRDNPFE